MQLFSYSLLYSSPFVLFLSPGPGPWKPSAFLAFLRRSSGCRYFLQNSYLPRLAGHTPLPLTDSLSLSLSPHTWVRFNVQGERELKVLLVEKGAKKREYKKKKKPCWEYVSHSFHCGLSSGRFLFCVFGWVYITLHDFILL